MNNCERLMIKVGVLRIRWALAVTKQIKALPPTHLLDLEHHMICAGQVNLKLVPS